jgi:hypothetical protein
VAGAAEFDSVSPRSAEADAVDSVLTGVDTDLEDGPRKVLAILRASMSNATPADLRSDAWVIRQNALRLLSAQREFLDRFAGPAAANLAARVAARVEHGVSRDAVGLTAVDGVGATRASKLATGGHRRPRDLVEAGVAELGRAGISEGVAERVVASARKCPAVAVEWGPFPDAIDAGDHREVSVTVSNRGGGARLGVRLTVNGVEMTGKTAYVTDETALPAVVFGAPDRDELEFRVEVTTPDLPLLPVTESRTVRVR